MAGRKISDTDALGNKTSYTYDEMNRLVKTESPFEADTSVTKYYYDRVSNLAKEKIKNNAAGADESYKEKDYAYDIMHNNVGVTIKGTYEDNSVQYEYNTAGQLTKMITGISRIDENIPETASVTSYEYDGFGYVSTITDATGKSSLYTNYSDGKTWITDDRKDNEYIDEYDLFGLKERCIYGDINGERRRERQLYEYNDIGQLLRKEIYVNDELTDSAAYEYDGFGRLTKETMNGISNNYTYDLNSNVTGHSISGADSDTQSVTYAYDAMNRITGISANSISRCSYEYDANGNMILKNTYGTISQITYNNANLPVSMVNKYAATEYNSYSFAYNVDGNRINETDSVTGISKSYQYDSFDRLQHEEVSKNGTVFITEYGYDLSGNRTDQYNSNGDIMSYDYNKNNCLTGSSTMTDETGEIQEIFEYDANGNMESRQIIDGTDVTVEQYIYDASNRLIEAEKDGLEISYEYNADGLRKSKTVNGIRTEYAWDRGNMCLERTNAGTDLAADRQYVYGTDGIAFSANDYTYVKNIHGDVTRVNDFLMGTQTNAYEYNSFGEITEMSESYENPFRYCGEYYDSETGWVYLRNRYYNPETGRFINEDPARDGSNWYTYCKNNPVTFVDPWGLYDRWAAVDYAMKYSIFSRKSEWAQNFDDRKPPVRFEQDCTNFISWCLVAGKLHSSDDWYYRLTYGSRKYVKGSYSKTWTVSEEQFKAFTNCTGEFPNSNYANGNAICIHESKWISAAIDLYGIRPGDVMYFQNPKDLKMGHTAIIVSTDNGRIKYAQHDDDKNDGDLGTYLDNKKSPEDFQYVYIVRIRDDA